jgi:cytoskeletal protein CcmA (bactofilin family)
MQAITDTHEGDLSVDDGDEVDVQGTVTGSCEVRGGRLVVSGTVAGDVTVLSGQVALDGEVAGDVMVHGGSVDVAGTIAGRLIDESDGDGEITVHPGSHVNGTEAPSIGA